MKRTTMSILAVAAGAALVAGTAAASTTDITEPTIVFSAGDPVVEIVDKDGVAALSLSTPTTADKAQVLVTIPDATLGDLESLSYRTLRDEGVGQQVASLNIIVDPWAGTFVYEPVYDSSATVTDGEWQVWDAFSDTARWWRSGEPDTFVAWEDIIAGFEGRQVTAIMVNQGSGNAGLVSAVDWVEVDGTTFDFTIAAPDPAPGRDDCKNGGWRTLGDFRNQGQCVSFFASGGRARN